MDCLRRVHNAFTNKVYTVITKRKTEDLKVYAKNDGSLLNYEERVRVALNLEITKHAKERLSERIDGIMLTSTILRSPLVYWNERSQVVVELENDYAMVIDCTNECDKFWLVTVLAPSANGYSVWDKMVITRRNYLNKVWRGGELL